MIFFITQFGFWWLSLTKRPREKSSCDASRLKSIRKMVTVLHLFKSFIERVIFKRI